MVQFPLFSELNHGVFHITLENYRYRSIFSKVSQIG